MKPVFFISLTVWLTGFQLFMANIMEQIIWKLALWFIRQLTVINEMSWGKKKKKKWVFAQLDWSWHQPANTDFSQFWCQVMIILKHKDYKNILYLSLPLKRLKKDTTWEHLWLILTTATKKAEKRHHLRTSLINTHHSNAFRNPELEILICENWVSILTIFYQDSNSNTWSQLYGCTQPIL